MKYATKREQGIALIREWANESVVQGADEVATWREMHAAMRSLIEVYCVQHDMPGVRYWYHPESEAYFTLQPGETLGESADAEMCIELTRAEFLGRQGIHGLRPFDEEYL